MRNGDIAAPPPGGQDERFGVARAFKSAGSRVSKPAGANPECNLPLPDNAPFGQTRSNRVKPGQTKVAGLTAHFAWRGGKAALARAAREPHRNLLSPALPSTSVWRGGWTLAKVWDGIVETNFPHWRRRP